MGLFGDLDIASAKEVSFTIPADTYEAIVSNFEVKPTKDGTKTGMNITYTVTQDGRFRGRTVTEWQRVPAKEDTDIQTPEQKEQAMGYIKKRLLSLGVPEDHINDVTPDEIIGTNVYMSVKVKPSNKPGGEDQNQVTKVVVMTAENTPLTSGSGAFS